MSLIGELLKYCCKISFSSLDRSICITLLLYQKPVILFFTRYITADQFPEKKDAVIVTTDRSWHHQFIEEARESARINSYDQGIERELKRALAEITRWL